MSYWSQIHTPLHCASLSLSLRDVHKAWLSYTQTNTLDSETEAFVNPSETRPRASFQDQGLQQQSQTKWSSDVNKIQQANTYSTLGVCFST